MKIVDTLFDSGRVGFTASTSDAYIQYLPEDTPHQVEAALEMLVAARMMLLGTCAERQGDEVAEIINEIEEGLG